MFEMARIENEGNRLNIESKMQQLLFCISQI